MLLNGPGLPTPATRRLAAAIYCLAVLVRATLTFGFGRYEIGRTEPVRIAISLARHGTFADPYLIPTGPTAHAAPFYPTLIAPIYQVLGDTRRADMVRMGLSILTGSAEYALLPYASAALGLGDTVGLAAGLAGAVLPLHHWSESQGDFESAWIALYLQLSVIFFARWMRAARFSAAGGLRAGLWLGWGLLLAPNLLPVLGGLAAIAIAISRPRIGLETIRWAVAFSVAACVLLLPWTIRNHAAIGGWFLVRDNFGMELASSNCDGARPDIVASRAVPAVNRRIPGVTEYAAAEVQRKGELRFERDMKLEAMAWIRAHPAEFARLTVARCRNFWFPSTLPEPNRSLLWAITLAAGCGLILAWRANRLAGTVLATVLATYPLVYYVIKNSLRYQHPIYWILLLLTAFLALRTIERARTILY